MNDNTTLGAFYLTEIELYRNRAQAQTNEVLRKMYNHIAELWLAKLQSWLNQK